MNPRPPFIATPADAAALLRNAVGIAGKREGFFVLPLDSSGRALQDPVLVSVGIRPGRAMVDVAEVFRVAFKADAHEIIVAHNHPNGDPTPSPDDLRLTRELKERAAWLGIVLLDHLIIGSPTSNHGLGFVSLSEIDKI